MLRRSDEFFWFAVDSKLFFLPLPPMEGGTQIAICLFSFLAIPNITLTFDIMSIKIPKKYSAKRGSLQSIAQILLFKPSGLTLSNVHVKFTTRIIQFRGHRCFSPSQSSKTNLPSHIIHGVKHKLLNAFGITLRRGKVDETENPRQWSKHGQMHEFKIETDLGRSSSSTFQLNPFLHVDTWRYDCWDKVNNNSGKSNGEKGEKKHKLPGRKRTELDWMNANQGREYTEKQRESEEIEEERARLWPHGSWRPPGPNSAENFKKRSFASDFFGWVRTWKGHSFLKRQFP